MSYYFIKSKLSGNVIDIQGASTKSGARLDAFPPKDKDNDNQLWEFVSDPTGFYFIKSKLSGNCVDIQGDSPDPGAGLDVFPQQTPGKSNQLWAFNPDPAGSGYFFIRSMLNGNVIDIQRDSKEPGAGLDAFPQKNSADNQLWEVVNGTFPGPVYTSISWAPRGTGAPNSSTVSSGGNECAYQAGLTISQDGSFTFSGYYQNRGDVWWGTAPPQAFWVSFVVFDTTNKAYAFTYLGQVPSAPQSGSLVTWNKSGKSSVIAENWFSIATKNSGTVWYYNSYDESIGSIIGGWFGSLASDLESLAEDVGRAIETAFESSGDEDDDGDDVSDASTELKVAPARTPLPPIPAGAPSGAAATSHKASAPVEGQGK
jgi:hypothetical protein